ncbi:MAG: mannose-6-phosphate isomerase, class I [Kineosporiaceae bacterium]
MTHAPDRPDPRSALGRPLRMRNPIRGYDWGSTTRLAQLQGRGPSASPEAELWMGAHQGDPSTVILDEESGAGMSLRDLVHRHPASVLGDTTLARFGVRLPFLLKVLGVERALSIQVHPGPEAAEAGFLAEEAAGVPLDAPHRRYLDRHAKPEFLYALTPFDALAGFREASESAGLVEAFGVAELAPVLAALRGHGTAGLVSDDTHPQLAALATLVHLPPQRRVELADAVAARARELTEAGSADPELAALLPWITKLAGEHPGDPLVTAPLLLRLHRLEPGGTIYLPAGVPHAYLLGTGVEIMGASDNVLRAGLTTKAVATEELLATLDPEAGPTIGAPARGEEARGRSWTFPAAEFALTHQVVDPSPRGAALERAEHPQIVLCIRGTVTIEGCGVNLTLRGGDSVFLPADCGDVHLSGDGEVFRASPGPAD